MDLAVLGIVIDPSRAKSGGKEAEAAFDAIKKKATDALGRIEAASAGLTNSIMSVRSAIIALGAVFAGRQIASTIAEFDRQMSTLQAVTGASREEINLLRNDARKLATTGGEFGPANIAAAMKELAQAGLTVNQVISAIPATLDLAVTANIDLKRSAEVTKAVMEAFGKNADQVRGIIDVMAVTANKTATDINAMGDAMKYVAPITNSLHISLEETSAAIGILANNGIQGSMAGTSLKSMLSSLASPTTQAQQALQSLGLTMRDVNPQTHSLSEIVTKLALSGMDTGRAFEIFSDRAAPAVLSLTSKAANFAKLSQELRGVKGASKEMSETIHDNLLGDFRAFSATVEAATTMTGEAGLTGGLRYATQQATALIAAVAGLSDPLDSANKKAYEMVEVLKLLGAAAAGFLAYKLAYQILDMATAVGVLVSSLAKLRLALVANPIGAVAVAIGLATAGFIAWKYAVSEADHELEAHMETIKRHRDLMAQGEKASTSSLQAEIGANQKLAEDSEKKVAELRKQVQEARAVVAKTLSSDKGIEYGNGFVSLIRRINPKDDVDKQIATLRDAMNNGGGVYGQRSRKGFWSNESVVGDQIKAMDELSAKANAAEGERLMALRYRAEAEKHLEAIQMEGLRREAGISMQLQQEYETLKQTITKNEPDPDKQKKLIEALDARFKKMKEGKPIENLEDSELLKFARSLDIASVKAKNFQIYVANLDLSLKNGIISQKEYDEMLLVAKQSLDETPLRKFADALDTGSARTKKYGIELSFLTLALKQGLVTQEEYTQVLAEMNRDLADSGRIRQFADGLDIAESRLKKIKRSQERLDEAYKAGAISVAGYAEAQRQLNDEMAAAAAVFDKTNAALLRSLSSERTYSDERQKIREELNRRLERGEISREDAFKYGVEDSLQSWKNASERMADMGRGAVQALDSDFSTFFDSLIDNIGDVGKAFKGLVASILRDMARLVIQQQVEKPLMNAIFSALGSSIGSSASAGATGATGDFGAGYGGQFANVAHTGGMVGGGLGGRYVNSRIFAGAPRFHTGGIAGDEVPIIARRGEGVFTPAQMRAMGGGNNITVQNNVTVQRDGSVQQRSSVVGTDDSGMAKKISDMVDARMRQTVTEMTRPGGILYQSRV